MQDGIQSRKLPIEEIFIKALKLPFKHATTILEFGAPFILVQILGIIYANFYLTGDIFNQSLFGPFFIYYSLMLITAVMAIVGCHRSFILTKQEVDNTEILRWSGKEWRYAAWSILIGIAISFVGMILIFIFGVFVPEIAAVFQNLRLVWVFNIVLYLPLFYIFSRWSLILPAVSIGTQGHDLSWAWVLSDGNGLRLTFLVGVLPFASELLFNLLPAFDSMLYQLIYQLVWMIVCVIEVCLLSLSYSYLTDQVGENSVYRSV